MMLFTLLSELYLGKVKVYYIAFWLTTRPVPRVARAHNEPLHLFRYSLGQMVFAHLICLLAIKRNNLGDV